MLWNKLRIHSLLNAPAKESIQLLYEIIQKQKITDCAKEVSPELELLNILDILRCLLIRNFKHLGSLISLFRQFENLNTISEKNPVI